MEIKKRITLSLTKRKGRFIAHSGLALSMMLGTSAAGGNQHLYRVEKVKHGWAVPKEIVQKGSASLGKGVMSSMIRLTSSSRF